MNAQAATPINVLVLEDRADDAVLMMAQLDQSGFTTVWQRVDNEKEYIDCLHAGLDLIIADYHLPQFDALRALHLLRERNLDIPFIIVSGTVGDDSIVEAMNLGASDFLLKDRMARLGMAVEGALERKALRRSHEEMVHKLRQAMAASEQTRSQLEAVFEAVADGIAVFDMDGNIVMANHSQARLIGFASTSEMKRNISYFSECYELRHPDGTLVPSGEWPPMRVLRGETVVNWEVLVARKDSGREWFFSYSGRPVYNERGWQVLAVITTHDITERKLAEASLRSANADVRTANSELSFYKYALDEAAHVSVTGADGTIQYVNDKFCEICGYSRAELVGQNPRMLNSQYHPDSFFEAMYRPITMGRVWRGEVRNRAKDGHPYWVDTTIIPMQDSDGRVTRYVAIHADITERKRAETALEMQRLEVETANHALAEKNEQLSELYQTAQRFVDDVSHEFRTPLSVIKGYSEIMRAGIAGPQSPDQMRFNQLIIDRTRDMAQMVDDLLDSGKLRAGSLRVDRRPCEIAAIFAAVHPIIDSRLAASRIQWVEEIDPALPLVFADAEKATRVLINLAVNAIKFSPEGSRVLLAAKIDAQGDMQISLTDQGPGISPENLELIFERFRQVGNAARITKGFGLGLNIAKELVALNLGQMHVESELQKGSTFAFTLPVNDPAIIVNHLLKSLSRARTASGTLAVLRVTPCGRSEKESVTAELHGFLACSSHPWDVIMPTVDHSSLILFGYSSSPGSWHRRLVRAGSEINQFSPSQKLCPFEVELVDTMPYPTPPAPALASILGHLRMECAHA